MNITTYNVNSVRARNAALLAFLDDRRPDVVCLQELKCVDEEFPWKDVEARGYHAAVFGQKTYNGVAILSRQPIEGVERNPHWPDDSQSRAILGWTGGVRVINLYVVNGQEVGSDKFAYKLDWLRRLREWVGGLDEAPTVICGDYNIAPADLDCYDPKGWMGQILVSDDERAHFKELCDLGYTDAFRHLYPGRKQYSWWDYRGNMFEQDKGLRIDHHLVSRPLLPRVIDCIVDTEARARPQASDHAAVTMFLRD